MIVTKNLAVSTIEVDLDNGVIWVNAPHCKLRISNLTIVNKIEEFSMIDIVDGKAIMNPKETMVNEGEVSEEMAQFLIHMTNYLHDQFKTNMKIVDKSQFLDDIKDSIFTCVSEKYPM